MCDPVTAIMVTSAVVGGVASYQGAQAQKDQYNYQAKVEDNNATIANDQRLDAQKLGYQHVQDNMIKTSQQEGSARADLAARGLDLGSGSAMSILDDIKYTGGIDNARIQDSANKQAWGYDVQRQNAIGQAGADRGAAGSISPGFSAFNSLLQSSGNIASKWGNRPGTAGDATQA